MTPQDSTTHELRDYLGRHPEEQSSLSGLITQLGEESLEQATARSNMRGHLTSSALVVDFAKNRVLLIFHINANRWLQPGGHFELSSCFSQGSPLAASALREVAEETGLQDAQLVPLKDGESSLLDVDSHPIKANSKKNEEAHVHHDFLYLASADSSAPLKAQEDEVSCARWADLKVLKDTSDARLARAYQKLVRLGLTS